MGFLIRCSCHALSVQVQTNHRYFVSKVIGDKALSIDLCFLLFYFKGRQYLRQAILSYSQLLTGRKRPFFPGDFIDDRRPLKLCVQILSLLKGDFFPHSWEDINPKINFSQMLHSARIYQLLLTNGLCCIQNTYTVQKLHW